MTTQEFKWVLIRDSGGSSWEAKMRLIGTNGNMRRYEREGGFILELNMDNVVAIEEMAQSILQSL